MKTLRHTLTTLSLALTTLLTPALTTGCQDDPLFSAPGYDGETATKAEPLKNPGALQKVGNYWVASRRVPLVGVGRVIDDLNPGLVSISGGQSSFSNITDTNLNNAASLEGIEVSVPALNPIVSVKDMYRTYAGGQQVGFVLGQGDDVNVLSAEVLGMMAIVTYLDNGNEHVYKLSEQGNLLNVGLLGSTSGGTKQTLSVTVTEPFDEVMLCTTGEKIEIGSGQKIYYAFVGETPEIKITNGEGGTFPNAYFSNTDFIDNIDDILSTSPEPEGYIGAGLVTVPILGALYNYHKTTLHLGKNIDPYTEIGFVYQTVSVANVSVYSGVKLTPYDANGGEITNDIYKQTGILDIKLIGGGIKRYSLTSDKAISALQIYIDAAVSVDLGGTSLLRAYTRAPIVVDPTSYFTVPETVQTTSASYRFMKPSEGDITSVNIVSNPGGNAQSVRPNQGNNNAYWYITGMEEGKTYQVEITYTGKDGKQFITTTTITHVAKEEKSCITHYMAGDGYQVVEAGDYNGITIIGVTENPENIVDKDYNTNFATLTRVASAIDVNSTLAAVKTSNGRIEASEANPQRVGFTIAEGPGLLGISALHFFTVSTYLNGTKQEGGVSAGNNIASVGLINTGQGSKMRVSIKATKPFDCVALQTVGALTALESFQIYNAFYEDASCEEDDVMDECSQLMTASLDNLQVDVDGFSGISVGNAGGQFSNMVDEDGESSSTLYQLLNLGNMRVKFTFDEQPANKWIGLMIRQPSGIVSADILNKMTVTIYHADGSTESSSTTGNLLGLDLIGFGEKSYIEACPTEPYTGMEVTFSGINVGEAVEIFGLYTTKDMNGNGKPDCFEPDPEVIRYVNLSASTEHQCLDAEGKANLDIRVQYEGINTEETYYLGCNRAGGSREVIPVKFSGNRLVAATPEEPLQLTQSGIYTLRLHDSQTCDNDSEISSEPLLLYIHPNHTEWNGNSGTDWNDWDNWSEGAPWSCTDVIIPGDLGDNYPILLKTDYDAGLNNCARIHIEDGGQIVNTQYLNTYEGAWVDVELQGGRYYMLASPLEDMVSGDWFISTKTTLATDLENTANGLPYFSSLNEVNYPEERISPTIYQRLWSTSAPVKNPDGYDGYNPAEVVMPDETQWTPPYNAVGHPYGLGMGFSLMAGKESNGGTSYLFRFPKLHHTYHYYNLMGTVTGIPESIERDYNYGKFIGEDQWTDDGKLTVNQTNAQANSYFLIGNPFVCHLNLSAFMAANGITEVKLFDSGNNTNNSLILIDGELVSNADGYVRRNIKPMEAFFVRTKDGAATQTIHVDFTRDMLTSESGTTGNSATTFTRSATPSALPASALRLTAALGGTQSHALLRVSPDASAGAVPGEDTRLLIEGEARPAVAVYTVADGQALDIQQVPGGPATIPLGFYLRDGGKADIRLTLDFTGSQWTDWFLVDQRTGQRRRITHTTLTLHDVENGSGQYALTIDN